MKKTPKNAEIYFCEMCNFKCSKLCDYTRHSTTAKHENRTNRTQKTPKNATPYMCLCGKKYTARNSLWYHKQVCNFNNLDNIEINENIPSVMDLLKQNIDFKYMILQQNSTILELSKNSPQVINNTTNNNQKFNLNFFLNTTCKDAMNMSEFIENLQVDFKDIENIGKQGYVSGMTNMILSRIKDLDITKRPLHCTDIKRETMYIKDNDEWCKDNSENEKLRDMISIVAKQNHNIVPLWRKQHPECNVSDHPSYNLCMDMMRNIIGDVGSEQARLDNKVIKNISRHIIVK